LSDKVTPSYEGMNFVAPAATIEGLKDCGLDLVTLANNHSTNYGNEVFLDSLENLTKNNIKYVGGGTNDKEAYEPVFFDISGVRFAFLNYNSIIGGVQAGPTTPGVSWIELKPWAEIDSETSIKRMEKEVAEAKKKADVAAVCFHWGVEYQLNPIQSQIDVAHKAIESGASLIIGTHPHVVQSIEYYESPKDKNGFIAYSLGNFIFDQMWSEDTREGVILKCQFLNKDLTNLELLPYKIEDYCQPNLLDKDAGQPIIDRIFSASGLSAHQ
jgi:poly-gamma-glutamate capsule biosynthesis protein CapA/YwtB (metallophosphatase superfamily)